MPWLTHGRASNNGQTHTITGLDFGAADADRWIIVGHHAEMWDADTVTGMTIGGVTATLMGTIQRDDYMRVSYWKAHVPTGTSGSVVVTYGEGSSGYNRAWNCGVAVARVIGEPTLHAIAVSWTHTSQVYSTTIDVPEDGELLALVSWAYDTRTTTWAGATVDFQDDDIDTPRLSGASASGLSAQTGRTVSATQSPTGFATNDALSVITVTVPGGGPDPNPDPDTTLRVPVFGGKVLVIGGKLFGIEVP